MISSANEPLEFQRGVTRVALSGLGRYGFALAGSGAVREHGVIDRPTEDIDLFTSRPDIGQFGAAVAQVIDDLRDHGYDVDESRRAPQFARLTVRGPEQLQVDIDLGVDWRERNPVNLELGPVLSLEDAVGNKVSALYSRGEPRDYLDVDAIRALGTFTDRELITAASERDAGFELEMFARQLEAARRVSVRDVEQYGIVAEALQAVKDRCLQWAARLREESAR